MYNMLFDTNPIAPLLLSTLGLTQEQIGRFRDCFLSGDQIAIYTRMGGGNREYWEDKIAFLQKLPGYLRDEDDDFDSTYATFYFSLPEKYGWLAALGEEEFQPDKRWKEKLNEIKTMSSEQIAREYPEVVALIHTITKATEGIVP